jgi:hypothetical protein
MPSTDRKLELKAKTSVAQTGSQPFVYAKGLKSVHTGGCHFGYAVHNTFTYTVVTIRPPLSTCKPEKEFFLW